MKIETIYLLQSALQATMLAFLQVNGIHVHPTNDEVARVGPALAAGEMKYEELLTWVKENTVY